MRRYYIAYVVTDYNAHTNDFFDITLEFEYNPTIGMIKDKIRDSTNFYDVSLTIISVINTATL
ncbi:MAG TPA: hypothetical protein VMV94_07020 [Phycisphaerae bacterium]|nr:hypothetical protein [Phycisphaerae bacterium]